MEHETEKNKVDFQYQAILDMQNTIRAIDTKIGFLLVILLIPLSNLSAVQSYLSTVCCSVNTKLQLFKFIVLFSPLIISWILAFCSAIRAIVAIDNPSSHISGCEQLKGSFYFPGLYQLRFRDFILNRKSVLAKSNLANVHKSIPNSLENISKELTFEQMKLAYIRDIKILRQKWAFIFLFIWLFFGFVIYLIKNPV